MKRKKLSFDRWECITSKTLYQKRIDTEFLKGYIVLMQIHEVSEAQIWNFNGQDIVMCDKGIQWLSILPEDEFYCITAMINEDGKIILWYIDMLADHEIDADGVLCFDDLYLDLIVHLDGSIKVDDMDELEEALANHDITQEQFDLAIATGNKLREGILSEINSFIEYTDRCYKYVGKAAGLN